MARPKTPEGKRVTISVKVSEAEAAIIDMARGELTRSAYLRSLITREKRLPGRSSGLPPGSSFTPVSVDGGGTISVLTHDPRPAAAPRAACRHPGVPRKALCRRCGKYNTG